MRTKEPKFKKNESVYVLCLEENIHYDESDEDTAFFLAGYVKENSYTKRYLSDGEYIVFLFGTKEIQGQYVITREGSIIHRELDEYEVNHVS